MVCLECISGNAVRAGCWLRRSGQPRVPLWTTKMFVYVRYAVRSTRHLHRIYVIYVCGGTWCTTYTCWFDRLYIGRDRQRMHPSTVHICVCFLEPPLYRWLLLGRYLGVTAVCRLPCTAECIVYTYPTKHTHSTRRALLTATRETAETYLQGNESYRYQTPPTLYTFGWETQFGSLFRKTIYYSPPQSICPIKRSPANHILNQFGTESWVIGS